MSTSSLMVRGFVATVVLCLFALSSVVASDKETFLKAPAWDLQYELVFTAASQGTQILESGTGTVAGKLDYIISLKRTLKAPYLLDLRSDGPSISMLNDLMSGKAVTQMTPAEQQKFSMDMLSRMDHTANWMNSGGMSGLADDASYEQQANAMQAAAEAQMGVATLDYKETVTGDDLRNEMGTPFKMTTRITHTGSDRVKGGGQITLELDVASSEYLLGMGYGWSDQSTSTVKIVEMQHREMEGVITDTTITSESGLNGIGSQIIPDDSTQMAGMMLMLRGSFDPAAGNIRGEHTLPAHYTDPRGDVRGTLLIRFTLTPRQ